MIGVGEEQENVRVVRAQEDSWVLESLASGGFLSCPQTKNMGEPRPCLNPWALGSLI